MDGDEESISSVLSTKLESPNVGSTVALPLLSTWQSHVVCPTSSTAQAMIDAAIGLDADATTYGMLCTTGVSPVIEVQRHATPYRSADSESATTTNLGLDVESGAALPLGESTREVKQAFDGTCLSVTPPLSFASSSSFPAVMKVVYQPVELMSRETTFLECSNMREDEKNVSKKVERGKTENERSVAHHSEQRTTHHSVTVMEEVEREQEEAGEENSASALFSSHGTASSPLQEVTSLPTHAPIWSPFRYSGQDTHECSSSFDVDAVVDVVDEVQLCDLVTVLPRHFPLERIMAQVIPTVVQWDEEDAPFPTHHTDSPTPITTISREQREKQQPEAVVALLRHAQRQHFFRYWCGDLATRRPLLFQQGRVVIENGRHYQPFHPLPPPSPFSWSPLPVHSSSTGGAPGATIRTVCAPCRHKCHQLLLHFFYSVGVPCRHIQRFLPPSSSSFSSPVIPLRYSCSVPHRRKFVRQIWDSMEEAILAFEMERRSLSFCSSSSSAALGVEKPEDNEKGEDDFFPQRRRTERFSVTNPENDMDGGEEEKQTKKCISSTETEGRYRDTEASSFLSYLFSGLVKNEWCAHNRKIVKEAAKEWELYMEEWEGEERRRGCARPTISPAMQCSTRLYSSHCPSSVHRKDATHQHRGSVRNSPEGGVEKTSNSTMEPFKESTVPALPRPMTAQECIFHSGHLLSASYVEDVLLPEHITFVLHRLWKCCLLHRTREEEEEGKGTEKSNVECGAAEKKSVETTRHACQAIQEVMDLPSGEEHGRREGVEHPPSSTRGHPHTRHTSSPCSSALVEWASGEVDITTDTKGIENEQQIRLQRTYYLPPTPAVPHNASYSSSLPSNLRDVAVEQLKRFQCLYKERQQYLHEEHPLFHRPLPSSSSLESGNGRLVSPFLERDCDSCYREGGVEEGVSCERGPTHVIPPSADKLDPHHGERTAWLNHPCGCTRCGAWRLRFTQLVQHRSSMVGDPILHYVDRLAMESTFPAPRPKLSPHCALRWLTRTPPPHRAATPMPNTTSGATASQRSSPTHASGHQGSAEEGPRPLFPSPPFRKVCQRNHTYMVVQEYFPGFGRACEAMGREGSDLAWDTSVDPFPEEEERETCVASLCFSSSSLSGTSSVHVGCHEHTREQNKVPEEVKKEENGEKERNEQRGKYRSANAWRRARVKERIREWWTWIISGAHKEERIEEEEEMQEETRNTSQHCGETFERPKEEVNGRAHPVMEGARGRGEIKDGDEASTSSVSSFPRFTLGFPLQRSHHEQVALPAPTPTATPAECGERKKCIRQKKKEEENDTRSEREKKMKNESKEEGDALEGQLEEALRYFHDSIIDELLLVCLERHSPHVPYHTILCPPRQALLYLVVEELENVLELYRLVLFSSSSSSPFSMEYYGIFCDVVFHSLQCFVEVHYGGWRSPSERAMLLDMCHRLCPPGTPWETYFQRQAAERHPCADDAGRGRRPFRSSSTTQRTAAVRTEIEKNASFDGEHHHHEEEEVDVYQRYYPLYASIALFHITGLFHVHTRAILQRMIASLTRVVHQRAFIMYDVIRRVPPLPSSLTPNGWQTGTPHSPSSSSSTNAVHTWHSSKHQTATMTNSLGTSSSAFPPLSRLQDGRAETTGTPRPCHSSSSVHHHGVNGANSSSSGTGGAPLTPAQVEQYGSWYTSHPSPGGVLQVLQRSSLWSYALEDLFEVWLSVDTEKGESGEEGEVKKEVLKEKEDAWVAANTTLFGDISPSVHAASVPEGLAALPLSSALRVPTVLRPTCSSGEEPHDTLEMCTSPRHSPPLDDAEERSTSLSSVFSHVPLETGTEAEFPKGEEVRRRDFSTPEEEEKRNEMGGGGEVPLLPAFSTLAAVCVEKTRDTPPPPPLTPHCRQKALSHMGGWKEVGCFPFQRPSQEEETDERGRPMPELFAPRKVLEMGGRRMGGLLFGGSRRSGRFSLCAPTSPTNTPSSVASSTLSYVSFSPVITEFSLLSPAFFSGLALWVEGRGEVAEGGGGIGPSARAGYSQHLEGWVQAATAPPEDRASVAATSLGASRRCDPFSSKASLSSLSRASEMSTHETWREGVYHPRGSETACREEKEDDDGEEEEDLSMLASRRYASLDISLPSSSSSCRHIPYYQQYSSTCVPLFPLHGFEGPSLSVASSFPFSSYATRVPSPSGSCFLPPSAPPWTSSTSCTTDEACATAAPHPIGLSNVVEVLQMGGRTMTWWELGLFSAYRKDPTSCAPPPVMYENSASSSKVGKGMCSTSHSSRNTGIPPPMKREKEKEDEEETEVVEEEELDDDEGDKRSKYISTEEKKKRAKRHTKENVISPTDKDRCKPTPSRRRKRKRTGTNSNREREK